MLIKRKKGRRAYENHGKYSYILNVKICPDFITNVVIVFYLKVNQS